MKHPVTTESRRRRQSAWVSAVVLLLAGGFIGVVADMAFGQDPDSSHAEEHSIRTDSYPDQRLDDPLPPSLEEALLEEGAAGELEYLRGLKDGTIEPPERAAVGPPVDDTDTRFADAVVGTQTGGECQPLGGGLSTISARYCWSTKLDGVDRTLLLVQVGTVIVGDTKTEASPRLAAVDVVIFGDGADRAEPA